MLKLAGRRTSRFVVVATLGLLLAPVVASAHAKPATACVVPNVKGDTLAQAKKKLTAAHCKLGTTTNPKIPQGYKATALLVSKQSVAAGKRKRQIQRSA